MTLDDFKGQLAEKHTGQFYLQDDRFIRHKTLEIRSFKVSACPLAAIFGDAYLLGSREAGMSVQDKDAIMDAADGYVGELRSWMLETLCT